MKNALFLVKAAFVLIFVTLIIYHKMHNQRVLIVHSYDAEYSWVKEENIGLNQVFSQHPAINLRWHYMDLKRHQDPASRRAATTLAMDVIDRWSPDVVILLDDIAQELIGKRYLNHPRIKLVFAGVNSQPEKYQYHTANNVTGILERKPLRALDDAIHALWTANGPISQQPRVVLIGDRSFDFAAGLFEYTAYQNQWRHLRWVNPQMADNFEDWKRLIFRAATVADFILVSDYRQLRQDASHPAFVSPEVVMQWTAQNSKAPVIGLTTAAAQDGAMLGIAAAGYEQGAHAASMAYALTQGTPITMLPMVSGQQSRVSIRKTALTRSGFEMPFIYEAFAKANGLHYE